MTAAVMPVRAVTFVGLLAVALAGTGLPLSLLAQEAEPPCAACHTDLDYRKFARSVHSFFSCTDCHAGADEFPHAEGVRDVDCSTCHAGAVEDYRAGIHGQARLSGATAAPDCAGCHGDVHALVGRSDPASPVHPANLAETCAVCHADPALVKEFGIPVARPVEAYRRSVHARALAAGDEAATCNDCHGSHGIFRAYDPRSKVFYRRVPETCGTCHTDIAATYKQSVHGAAVARGATEAPVCTDCHGEHRILSPSEPGSPVFPTNIPLMTCGRCHNNLRLTEKYGLPQDKVPAYEDSYHGLAARAGAQTVANCASCHGVHDILPSSDPRSHVHPANLPATCGQCHPGAGRRFALGPVHVSPTTAASGAAYYVRLIYLPLIFFVIGAMALHNLLDFIRKARSPAIRHLAAQPPTSTERMSLGFRIAHWMVVVSFPLLVYTGFALTYPESWWAYPVNQWEADLGLRGWLHRAAALVLLGSVVFHGIHLWRSPRARRCIAGMVPTMEDVREFLHRVRYYLALNRQLPASGQLGYIEKAEYLAFLWGTVIMALTGFLLWFEDFTLRWAPKWVTDASTAIHFYEAILASLAILVWHLYWVIFDPAVYPMDPSWWSGKEPASRAAERSAHGSLPAAAPAEDSSPSKKQGED